MNRKQLLTLVVLVVVVGGLGLLVLKKRTASYTSTGGGLGEKVLGEFQVNDVVQVQIKQPSAEVNLAKKEELWRVAERYDYPADFSALADLLRKLADLKFVQREEVGPSQLGRLDLLQPGASGAGTNAGTLVQLKDDKGKVIRGLLLGKKHLRQGQGSGSPFGEDGGWPDGRYLMALGDSQRVGLISDPLSNVEAKPEQWLSKEFFKVEKIKGISVTSTNATNQWKISRETEGGEMKMADLKPTEQFDTGKASSLSYVLSSPSFVDVVAPDRKPEELGLVNPLVATLETFDNFIYTITVGNKTNDDNYFMKLAVKADLSKERTPGKEEKPEDKEKLDKEFKDKQKKLEEKLKQEKNYEKWTYLVSKWTIDPLLKGRGEFLSEKKEEPKKEEPKKEGETLGPVELKPSIDSGSIPGFKPEPPPLPTRPEEKKPKAAEPTRKG